MSTSTAALHVAIVVFDDVEVLDCCGPFEVFSVANRVAGRAVFDVRLVATTSTVTARGGLVLGVGSRIVDAPAVDVLVVAGGVTDEAERDAALVGWLREVSPTTTASVCTGAFLLATAGILVDQRVTTHHDDQDALAERWPALRVERGVRWVHDGGVWTSAGISAGIDLALELVAHLADRDLARATAAQMEYDWREAG